MVNVQATMAGAGMRAALASLGLAAAGGAAPTAQTYEAEAAVLRADRVEVVAQESFAGGRGVSLRTGVTGNLEAPQEAPDLVFTVKAPAPGRYWIHTHAATDGQGTARMSQTRGKQDSLRLLLSVAGTRPARRVVFVPWSRPESCTQALGKYELGAGEQEVRVWLPEGVRLDCIRVSPYVPPPVPAAAAAYQPTVVPPPPRGGRPDAGLPRRRRVRQPARHHP